MYRSQKAARFFRFSCFISPVDCAPANVAAAEAVRPVDEIDSLIRAALGFGNGGTDGGDVQHAAACGDELAVLTLGGGMENLDAFGSGSSIDVADLGSFGVIAR